jgi:type I restriction enzyme, S subunit
MGVSSVMKFENAPFEIIDGDRGKNYPKQHEFLSEGYCLFLSAKNVTDEGFIFKECQFISKEKDDALRKGKLRPDDVVLTTRGTVGNVAYYSSRVPFKNIRINSGMVILRPDKSGILPSYLYYYLKSTIFHQQVNSFKSGVAQPQLPISDMKQMIISIPPLIIQNKIAAIISAYDDLIENNLRRIKILEEMVHNLYREWFVNFRFPGHEKVRFVDSPLGRIPEGWGVVSFTDVADVLSGGTPKTSVPEYWGGHIPFFAPKDAPPFFYVTETEKTITELGLKKCNSQLYPPETVFITARGTVGKVVLADKEMAMNQSCYALRAKDDIGQKYLYLLTLNQVEYLKKNTGGSTFSTIVVDTFRRMQIVKAPFNVIEEFEMLIEPNLKLMVNLIHRNSILRQTRDLLLPKLISGEVDVSELDISAPEEAAS